MGSSSKGVRYLDKTMYVYGSIREEDNDSKYDHSKTYKSQSGACVYVEKGHNLSDDEKDVAYVFADEGLDVWLTNEGNFQLKDKNGKFVEGLLSGKKISYEQSTPTRKGKTCTNEECIKRKLEHAKSKKAEIAVIYDKEGMFSSLDIKNGIVKYESFKNNIRRFKVILVVDKYKNIWEWHHTKIE